jgi:hypothetical protein
MRTRRGFEFPNMALDDYTVSAPAPPHEDADVTGILETLSGSPTNDELQAAIQQAFEIFTGVNNPLLNGEGLHFNPSSWGYEKTELFFDGQTVFADVRYLPGARSRARLNGQGVPIGARVRLTGIGPTREGDAGFIIRGERNSDPALGTFSFTGQALAGDFGVQAATPFFPAPISVSGKTSRIDPDRTDLVLQFPSENQVNGRLAGRVLAPDGSLVANAKVKISFGDLEIRSDATGRFDTQLDLPAFDAEGAARSYRVEAEDETTGLREQSFVTLRPGITNLVDVRLPRRTARCGCACSTAPARRWRTRRGRAAGQLPERHLPGYDRRERQSWCSAISSRAATASRRPRWSAPPRSAARRQSPSPPAAKRSR